MNIGEAAKDTGLSVKTIRYYEEIGLVAPTRAGNGYRDFTARDRDRLRLVAQARLLGFTLDECRKLVALNDDDHRSSRDVRALAQENLATVRARLAELRRLETRLVGMIAECHGDDAPDCAILDALTDRVGAEG
ncbi:MAG: MerR family transcriptional regulator [Maritimibacter sp.]|nr:MerR family transcriptional regulator [Maritimibacter sp.]